MKWYWAHSEENISMVDQWVSQEGALKIDCLIFLEPASQPRERAE